MENLWMWVALICFVPGEWRSEDPSREWLLTGWGESEEIFGRTIWNSNIPKIHSFPNSKAFSYLIVLTYGYNANYFVVFMLALNQKLVCWKFLFIFFFIYLFFQLGLMEQQLEELLDTVMCQCRYIALISLNLLRGSLVGLSPLFSTEKAYGFMHVK